MDSSEKPTAFVAMRFSDHPWKDKRYLVIKKILEDGGFNVVRADEITTSGPVVEEVCRHLRESKLVVIDSTGDSHSVSYEIGYCHGIGRAPESTVLICEGTDIPFNYRHFRHRCYNDLRELRKLLRFALRISEPVRSDQYGYLFSFQTHGDCAYALNAAVILFDILAEVKFSGRCECYSGNRFNWEAGNFTITLFLRIGSGNETAPNYEWWKLMRERLGVALKKHADLSLNTDLCEFTRKHDIAASDTLVGCAEFKNGEVFQVLGAMDYGFFNRYMEIIDFRDAQDEHAAIHDAPAHVTHPVVPVPPPPGFTGIIGEM